MEAGGAGAGQVCSSQGVRTISTGPTDLPAGMQWAPALPLGCSHHEMSTSSPAEPLTTEEPVYLASSTSLPEPGAAEGAIKAVCCFTQAIMCCAAAGDCK